MSIENSYTIKKSGTITTFGRVPKEVLHSLSDENYEVVIKLLPGNHKQTVPDEKEIVEGQSITYVHIPVEFEAPKHEDLENFIGKLKKIRDRKVHIHCAVNCRVSAFYGIYALQHGLWSKEEANSFISSIWNPAEYPAWSRLLDYFGLGLSE